MELTQAQRDRAAALAVYTEAAENLLAAADQTGRTPPPLTGTTLEVCWETLGQFRANDDTDWVQKMRRALGLGQSNFFYGLLLRCTVAQPDIGFLPGDLLAVIRGTGTAREWLLNVCALMESDRTALHSQGGQVPDGFYSIYKSMEYWDAGGTRQGSAAGELATFLRPGGPRLVIAGHSLGAAITSYMAYDVANAARAGGQGAALSLFDACMIACPQPGDMAYAKGFQAAVPSYTVVNWCRDIVPDLPPCPYVTLLDGGAAAPGQNVMTLANVTWVPADGPLCNHHAVCYARMLNPLNPVAISATRLSGC